MRSRFILIFAALLAPATQAQLRLPVPSLPALPTPSQAPSTLRRDLSPVNEAVRGRQQRIGEMLRARPALVEADPAGEPAVRGQVLLTS
ncbi:MAG TPA: hypothetical protein VGP22_06365, partial [Albitalea sp.]|nr:hypothetical protein [Albitalea sp.]